MLIQQIRVDPTLDGYCWVVQDTDMEYRVWCDERMDSIMGAFREVVRRMARARGIEIPKDEKVSAGSIWIDRLAVEPTVTQPGSRLEMGSGLFTIVVYVDPTVESWLAALGAAMRFFAYKHGLVTVFEDVTRNTQAAHEQGFLTN